MNTATNTNKPTTIDGWRDYISEPWQKAVESIIETGRRLIETKEHIEHGDWMKIFENNKPFSYTTAARLMAIAKHQILSNLTFTSSLPPAWGTLYYLSRIEASLLSKMVEDGRIHPDLTQDEAIELGKVEEQRKQLLDLLLHNAFMARELSLANCGGAPYDFSLLKGYVTEELKSTIREAVNSWTELEAQILLLGEVTS